MQGGCFLRELQIKPILWFLMRSFCAPVLKYKSAQILQLETHARTCYNFYKISFVFFIPLGTLVRYTDRKGGEAVEYSNHELVRGIKGGDMIITTNIPIVTMQKAASLDERRIYDRILEVCVPIRFDGKNFRRDNAKHNLEKAAQLLRD